MAINLNLFYKIENQVSRIKYQESGIKYPLYNKIHPCKN